MKITSADKKIPDILKSKEMNCIYMDGELKGQEDNLFILPSGLPCDTKIIPFKGSYIKYRLKYIRDIKTNKCIGLDIDNLNRYKMYQVQRS